MLTLDQINEMINDTKEIIVKDFAEYTPEKMSIMLEKLVLTAAYYGQTKEHEENATLLSILM